ncbi:MAG TPA: sugar transferase [Candidatus Binatia bacterium]|nr:sugar transferase [Candidatus Binatia bacterium]
MTNPRRTALLAALKLADLGVVIAAFVVALCIAIPGAQSWSEVLEMRIEVRNVLFMAVYLCYWHLVLMGFGLYRSHRLAPISREWRDLLSAVLLAATPIFLFSRLLRFEYANAGFLVNFSLLAFLGLATERRVFRVLARTMRRHGHNLRNAIVVGLDQEALDMASRLARRADLGYRIVEVLETARDGGQGQAPARLLQRLASVIARNPIDEVFIAAPLDTGQPLIRGVMALCEEQGITVRLVSSIADLAIAKAQVDEIDGRPVITVFTGPPDSPLMAVKRLIDVTISLAALIVLAPVFALIAVAIRLDSPGPVFFVQRRVGLGGRQFSFFKFRTMVKDAERMQAKFEHLNEADGPVFKIRDDPRVTRIGRWVRRTSLDELPQLINVLKGDMSLVGPRPLPLRDVARMDVPAHRRRFSVKPGITCLWQIEGREPRFEDWIRTDMAYIDNWSLGLDFKILARTIPAVLSGRGAY